MLSLRSWLAGVAAASSLAAAAPAYASVTPSITQACKSVPVPHAVALIELYTSEGCDSCPPADKWLSTLTASEAIVPIAWHVDYWDRLGWKDRFARADAAVRQAQKVRLEGGRTSYTPQVMIQGRSQYFGDRGAVQSRLLQLRAAAAPAQLSISHTPVAGSNVRVDWQVQGTGIEGGVVMLALLEDDLVSQVSAGENRGVTLKHDHVVRQLSTPQRITGVSGSGQVSLAMPADARPSRTRIIAWLEDSQGHVLTAAAASRCQ
jgi:hypothetical protein